MKKLIHYLFLVSTITVVFSNCKKYENGPDFSLLPKKERLANKWRLDSYSENGVDKTTTFNTLFQNAVLKIEKNGDYALTYKAAGVLDYSETGTWRFANDKNDFETNPTSGTGSVAVHHILRLKDTELWYYDVENGTKKEYHLKP